MVQERLLEALLFKLQSSGWKPRLGEKPSGKAFQGKGSALTKALRSEKPGLFEKLNQILAIYCEWGQQWLYCGHDRDFFFFWPYHAAWGGLSSLTREQTHAPAVELKNLNRWNARKVLAMKRISKSYCWYRSKLVGNCSLSPLAATASFPTKHLICTWSPYCPHLRARRCQWGSSPDPGLSPSRHPTFPRSYWR